MIRIIGGQFRRKLIPVLESEGLRPTPDGVRETLFNWLMHDIKGAVCLDLFAGTGALGFEAYSRGASKVIFVEKNKKVFLQLQKTARTFSASDLICLHQDGLSYLKTADQDFDIIFLDPPFDSGLLKSCLECLQDSTLGNAGSPAFAGDDDVSPPRRRGSIIYIESDLAFELPSYLQCIKYAQSGRVKYGLYSIVPAEKCR